MNKSLTANRSIFAIIALYCATYLPLLFQRGAYWDGWLWLNQFIFKDYNWIYLREFAPQRLYHSYLLFRVISTLPDGIFAAKLVIFLSWLLSGLLLLYILRHFLSWDKWRSTVVVLYYLIFPIFFVRFEVALTYYSMANLFFVLGSFIMFKLLSKNLKFGFSLEIIGAFLFVLSFFLNSFLFFFLVFLGVHFYIYIKKRM